MCSCTDAVNKVTYYRLYFVYKIKYLFENVVRSAEFVTACFGNCVTFLRASKLIQ